MKKPQVEQGCQYITIRVRGHLPGRYLEHFENMQITKFAAGETLISGEVKDQAQLFGILIRIRDLGIPLLEISYGSPIFTTQEINND